MTGLFIATMAGCTPPSETSSEVNNSDTDGTWSIVTSTRESEVANGFLVLSRFDLRGSEAFVLSGDGSVVWRSGDPGDPLKINRVRLAPDGQSVLYAAYDRARREDIGSVTRVDLSTGTVLSTTRTAEQHHDFVAHEAEGTLSWLSWTYGESTLGLAPIPIASDALRTAAEGSLEEDPTRIYDFLDHYPEDPFWSCDHMSFNNFAPDHYEWSHSNSLVYVPEQDAYFVMVRYWDAVLKIDRQGTLAWQLGGLHGDFDLTDPFHHAHMSEVWPGGMLIFDNADHADPSVSGVAEYAWDEATMTADKIWEYRHPEGHFVSHLGDARRLPGGNTLISWGPLGTLTEITSEGEVVWELETDGTLGRVTWIEALP